MQTRGSSSRKGGQAGKHMQHQSGGCGQEYLDSLLVFSKCLVEFTKPSGPAFSLLGGFLITFPGLRQETLGSLDLCR